MGVPGVGNQHFLTVLLAQPSHLQWPQLSLQNGLSLCSAVDTEAQRSSLIWRETSPAPLSAANDLHWEVNSSFIKGNNSPVCCKKYHEDGLQLEVAVPCAVGNAPVCAAGQFCT